MFFNFEILQILFWSGELMSILCFKPKFTSSVSANSGGDGTIAVLLNSSFKSLLLGVNACAKIDVDRVL